LQTLRCVPLGSDVGCASGKNIDCVPESSRALRLLRPRVVVLLAWPQLVLQQRKLVGEIYFGDISTHITKSPPRQIERTDRWEAYFCVSTPGKLMAR
jgi:hypothetical protein